MLVAAAVAGAVLLSDAAPTGQVAVDAVFRGAVAGLVTAASSRARRWSWLAASAIVCLATPMPWLAVGVGALAVSLAAAVFDVRRRDLSAAVGTAVTLAAFHIDLDHPVGASAALAALALGILAVSGVRTLRRRQRRRVLVGVALTGALATAIALMFLFTVLGVQGEADRAVELARSGLTAARRGEQEEAVRALEDAQVAFERAREGADGLLAKPALLVPGLAHNARALQRMADAGADLAGSGASAASQADVQSLQLQGGALDLARVAAMEAPLAEATDALEEASADLDGLDSPWLVGPLGSALGDLRDRVDEALPDARVATDAVRLAPGMLGADGPRRYFVAFVTPSEQRGSGGILGNFAQLDAVDGRISLSRTGRAVDLNTGSDELLRTIEGMPEFTARYSGWAPARFWQNVTVSPDFPTTARVIEQLYFQSGGVPIDGVISVDPKALAALLRLTGPVRVPGLESPLTAENAEQILLRDQYIAFPERPGRVDFLEEASRLTFEALTTRDLPQPRVIATTLNPVVRADRLRAHSVHPEEQELFDRLGMSGRLPPVEGDYLGVVTENGSANKIDLFLHREVTYDVTVDPGTGEAEALLELSLRNEAPASGLPDYVIGNAPSLGLAPGFSRVWVSVYSAMFLEEATADGQPFEMAEGAELGRQVYSQFVTLAPGQTMVLRLALAGPLDLSERYRLDIGHQPMANPDEVEVSVRTADGFTLTPVQGLDGGTTSAGAAFTMEQRMTFVAELARS